jgi:alcohol dehydrogenase class IV
MSAAALFGGIVLANAGLGAIHGIAGPLGGMIDAPHGAICSALAAQVVAINVRALRQRDSDNPALGRELKIPRLGELGLDRADIPELVEKSLRANSMKGNPILLAAEELREIIEASL